MFVGLGNPGTEYEDTRHNAGFWWIDAIARELKLTLVPDKSYHGLVARTSVHGQTVWLLEPQTYMNRSGQSVAALARFFKIQPDEILVAHDELDIVPGQVKLKRGGSHAGHNGLRDIHAQLGTPDYWRLRLGIGPFQRPLVDFVLEPWTDPEWAVIDRLDAPFAQFLALLAAAADLSGLANLVNPAAFWDPA